MTNFLGQVTNTIQQDGQRMIIAGVEGVGKTTLLASAPRALFIPLEGKPETLQVFKTPMITTWSDLIGLMDELRAQAIKGSLPYKSLCFDSFTAIERILHDYTISQDQKVINAIRAKQVPPKFNMETAHEGYGKAYAFANNEFNSLLFRFDELARYAKLNIILTCHVFTTLVKDSAFGEYNSWDLLLHSPKNEKNYGKREMVTQWADFIGYLHEPLFVSKSEGGQMMKGLSAGQGRMMAVNRTPGWVAKNRYNIPDGTLISIPKPPVDIRQYNGWNYIADPIYKGCGIDVFNYETLTQG